MWVMPTSSGSRSMGLSERIPSDDTQHNDARANHGRTADHRPRKQGLVGRPPGDLRHRRLSRQVLLPALQDAGLPLEFHDRPRTAEPSPRADPMRQPASPDHDGTRGVPRPGAGRLGGGRTTHGLSTSVANPDRLERPPGGQDGRRRLGRHLLRDPQGPQPRSTSPGNMAPARWRRTR
jgi:hypothetical protein